MPCCVDFGIIPKIDPNKNYQPSQEDFSYQEALQYYRCISVDDDIVNEWIVPSMKMPTYLFSLDRPSHGIDHYAVTLVPPSSLPELLEIVKPWREAEKGVPRLIDLIQEAIKTGKYMIVYGV